MSDPVLILWWLTLIVVAVVVVPVVLYLLNRTFRSANDIRVYTAEILAAAQGLARNLEPANELERTPELALRVRDAASGLAAEAARLDRLDGDKS